MVIVTFALKQVGREANSERRFVGIDDVSVEKEPCARGLALPRCLPCLGRITENTGGNDFSIDRYMNEFARFIVEFMFTS